MLVHAHGPGADLPAGCGGARLATPARPRRLGPSLIPKGTALVDKLHHSHASLGRTPIPGGHADGATLGRCAGRIRLLHDFYT